ncbi:MAG: undecaprenyl-diphosphate phosphatase [Synergistaceae bacterium]|jgi:undecaprenyl-diphosphatase|nr:undecaprenyl-diphosphate phosphatase [Synergistaceae bacterium]
MSIGVVFLGLVQGVTEFLPVSSSGHLALAKAIFGYGDMSLAFDLTLHVATLLAVFLYFFRDIASLLIEWVYGFFNSNARRWTGWRFGWAVILGTLVTGPIGILLKPLVEGISGNMMILGVDFLITGGLLLSSRYLESDFSSVGVRSGIVAGLFQGLAVLPGVSRSGSTIWAGLFCGMSRDEAFRFSFLLSIPAIIGASIYEAKDLGGFEEFMSALPSGWFYASCVAFVSGLVSLSLLRKLVTGDRWWVFSLYCAALACVIVIYSLIGA